MLGYDPDDSESSEAAPKRQERSVAEYELKVPITRRGVNQIARSLAKKLTPELLGVVVAAGDTIEIVYKIKVID